MIRHALAPALLLLCLLLGGASAGGYLGNLVLELASLPLIAWSLWRLGVPGAAPLPPGIRSLLWLIAAAALLLAAQLILLPPALWSALPGRGAVLHGYALLGIAPPWLPLTLAPGAAVSSIVWLLPALGVLLAMTLLGAYRARWIGGVILSVALIGIAVGALQVIGGDGAYFYAITNFGVAVGFFANANHNATLMLCAIPFLAATQASLLARARSPRAVSAIRLLVAAAYAVIVVGLLINQSLAGLGLAVPVSLGSWLAFGRMRPGLRRFLLPAVVASSVAALLVIVVGPFGNNLFGTQTANIESSRQTSFTLTWQASLDYLPLGAGIGSFVPIYHTHEPAALVTGTFMNHAHSDWLELWLEAGVPGLLLVAAFLWWWTLRVRALARAEEPDPFARAAIIATAAVMVHSFVDYPLRTAAIEAVFAACVALMAGARPHVRRTTARSSGRHLSL